ncbi:MAG: hypothetical protein JST88_07925 [Bacteroidetes bacterium]|nr:hypothetical protein [Bacteroidota bacterium]
MGGCNRQSLAEGMGVHREVESEEPFPTSRESRRQNPVPRNTNPIRHIRWDKTAKQVEVQRLHGQQGVNRAERWDESELSYQGRSHKVRRAEFCSWTVNESCRKDWSDALRRDSLPEEQDGIRRIGKSYFVRRTTENNVKHIPRDVKAGNRCVPNGTHGGVRGQIGN